MLGHALCHALCHALSFHSQTVPHSITNNGCVVETIAAQSKTIAAQSKTIEL